MIRHTDILPDQMRLMTVKLTHNRGIKPESRGFWKPLTSYEPEFTILLLQAASMRIFLPEYLAHPSQNAIVSH